MRQTFDLLLGGSEWFCLMSIVSLVGKRVVVYWRERAADDGLFGIVLTKTSRSFQVRISTNIRLPPKTITHCYYYDNKK